jgi:hypothetical protein
MGNGIEPGIDDLVAHQVADRAMALESPDVQVSNILYAD